MAKPEETNQLETPPTIPHPQEQEVNPYDDATLRRLAPEAYGPHGFDPITAQLLVRGYFVPPNAAAALKIRVEAELTGHHHHHWHGGGGASSSHGPPKRKKPRTAAAAPAVAGGCTGTKPSSSSTTTTTVASTASAHTTQAGSDVLNDPGDRAPWDDEMTRLVVDMHAKRVSFKNISGYVPGKGVKACQEHYYRVVKDPRWKERHDKTRQEHDNSGSEDTELQASNGGGGSATI